METNYLREAFQKLNLLNEDSFDLSKGQPAIDELQAWVADDIEAPVEVEVVDTEAGTAEELKDNYIGKVILECECCHSRVYKNQDEVVIDEETGLANIEEECPVCGTASGWTVIGKIEAFDATKEFADEEEHNEDDIPLESEEATDDVEEDSDEEFEESFKKAFNLAVNESVTIDINNGTVTSDAEEAEVDMQSGTVELCNPDCSEEVLPETSEEEMIAPLSDEEIEIIEVNDGEEPIEELPLEDEVTDEFPLEDDIPMEEPVESEEEIISTEEEPEEESEEEDEIGESLEESADLIEDRNPELEAQIDEYIELVKDDPSIVDDEPIDEFVDIEGVDESCGKKEESLNDEDEIKIYPDFDLEEFDDESFNKLGESFLRRVYENVDSFSTSKVESVENNSLVVEGLITFTSGKQLTTKFNFLEHKVSKKGAIILEGLNETFSNGKHAFKLRGSLTEDKKFICESMIYNYSAKTLNESNESETVKVFGRVKI